MYLMSMINLAFITYNSLMTTLVNNIMIMWIFMEMSNTSFLMMNMYKEKSSKTMMFLMPAQVISSSLILISIIIKSYSIMNFDPFLPMGIMMKMGLFPLESWLYKSIKFMSWNNIMILLTTLKIPPFMIMMNNNYSTMFMMSMFMSPIIASIKAITLIKPKEMMAPSSIIHSSWMCLISIMEPKYWMMYFSIYSTLMMMTYIMIKKLPETEMFYQPTQMSLTSKMSFMMLIIMMIGLPPALTFYMKIQAIEMISMNSMIMFMMSMITSSIFSIIIYTRIFITMMMMNFKANKLKTKKKSFSLNYTMTFIMLSSTLLLIK